MLKPQSVIWALVFDGRDGADVYRCSLKDMTEVLKSFLKTASTAHSSFHTEKAEANPAILHAEGSSKGYEQAKHAIERDLKHVLRSHTGQQDSVTYSVHYSDVNGLSKLENFILGLEIGTYLGELSSLTTNNNHANKPQNPKTSPTSSPPQPSSSTRTSPAASQSPSVQSHKPI